ncbi:MAG: hypothetical protein AAFP86_13215, partial [Planctomycetota bacterium]
MIRFSFLTAVLLALPGVGLAQTYALDDGIANVGGGTNLMGAPGEVGFLQAFSVPGGGTDVIESVSVVFAPYSIGAGGVSSLNGAPVRVAVWEDPNDDGLLSDAVLVASEAGHVASNVGSGLFETFALSAPATVSGGFFIGATIEVGVGVLATPGALDDSAGFQFDSWYFGNAGGAIDLVSLNSNTRPPSNLFLPGRYLLRANDGDYGATIGAVACVSAPNSTGQSGELRATGYDDAAAGPLRVALAANRLPSGQPGFFVASKQTATPVTPPGSSGQLCLGGSILRILPSLQTTQSGAMVHE